MIETFYSCNKYSPSDKSDEGSRYPVQIIESPHHNRNMYHSFIKIFDLRYISKIYSTDPNPEMFSMKSLGIMGNLDADFLLLLFFPISTVVFADANVVA